MSAVNLTPMKGSPITFEVGRLSLDADMSAVQVTGFQHDHPVLSAHVLFTDPSRRNRFATRDR